jgi:hypothetical protein
MKYLGIFHLLRWIFQIYLFIYLSNMCWNGQGTTVYAMHKCESASQGVLIGTHKLMENWEIFGISQGKEQERLGNAGQKKGTKS